MVGCSINEFIEASLDLALTGHTVFDFGDEEDIDANSNKKENE
jgi:hypothetical protein